MTRQNDRQNRSLAGQVRDQAGHCPLTSRYFQPCHELWRIALWLSWDKGCGELHCDSVEIKAPTNSILFFLRHCESLDWNDCSVVLLLSATHFMKSSHAQLIRRCFSFSQCFRPGVFLFSLPAPSPLPLTRPISSSLQKVSKWRFREQKKLARPKETPSLQAMNRIEDRVLQDWFLDNFT